MKHVITDDSAVRALAERIGAWPAIERAVKAGHSGVVLAPPWVIGYYADGFIAVEESDPVAAIELARRLTLPLPGPFRAEVYQPEQVEVH